MYKTQIKGAAIALGTFVIWIIAAPLVYQLTDSLLAQAVTALLVAACGALWIRKWSTGKLIAQKALKEA